MAKLYFRYSSMGAGKSIDLLKVWYNYEERGHRVLSLTAGIDNRFGTGKIATRIGISRDCETFNNQTNLIDLVESLDYTPSAILIDEAQFLTREQVDQLAEIVDFKNIPVMCYGLRADFRNELFEGSARLLAIADDLEEMKTICECGKKATVNMRLFNGVPTTEGDQIMIGNLEYKSMCRRCYKIATRRAKNK